MKLALNGPILFVAVAVKSVSEFLLKSSHPGIDFCNILGLFRAYQTFCFSNFI